MGKICFWISLYGMKLKLKFGAIKWLVNGLIIFGVIFMQNKTPDYESDVL